MDSRYQTPQPHRAQGDTGLHRSLPCQRSRKNLQCDHQPAVFTMLSSKLKEPEESPEVKGSREENVLNVNLTDSTTGLSVRSNPRDVGRSQKTQYTGTWGAV